MSTLSRMPSPSSVCLFDKIFSSTSVQFSRSVVSNSLWPHGLQHTWLPCPSPTPGNCSNSFHRVSDAIQPSHPLSSPSPHAFNLSQHQILFHWVSYLHQVAEVLELQLQHQSFQWTSPLGWTGWISLQSKGLSRVFSNTTVQKHQFFGTQLSLWSSSHIHNDYWKNQKLWLDRPLSAKECLCFLICRLGWS